MTLAERLTREPVAIINALVTLVEAGLALVVLVVPELSEASTAGVLGTIIAVGEVLKTLLSRSKVTPVSDPRNDNGFPLLPAIVKQNT